MSRQHSEEVTFHDASACFSEEEWTLLHEWQKELYRNVMEEIHQALLSLGPLIATTVFSLRTKETEVLCPVDDPGSGRQRRCNQPPSATMSNDDVLLRINTEETLHLNHARDPEAREMHRCLSSAEFPVLNTVCSREEEPVSIFIDHLGAEMIEGSSGDPSSGHEVVTFHLKNEEDSYCMEHRDSQRMGSTSSPTAGPVITSVFSLLQYLEEIPLQEDLEAEETDTGDESMNRNKKDGECITYGKIPTLLRAQSEKAKVKEIQRSENRINCGSQLWPRPKQELGGENTIHCESSFGNPAHSNLLQETHNLEISTRQNTVESNLMNTKFPTCPPITQQHPNTECEDDVSHMSGRTRYHQAHNPQKKKPYQCTQCDKSFYQKGGLLAHHRTHARKQHYQCSKCEKSYSMKAHLVNHQRSHTPDPERDRYLTECRKSLIQKGHLMTRLTRHNAKRKVTECEEIFVQKGGSITDTRTDKVDKPHKCTECEKSFHRKGGLVIHYRTHTGEKPYQCTTCEKSFSIKRNLVVHQRRHTTERPYQCTQCEKSFLHNGYLMVHLRRHNEKGKSTECEKSLFQKGGLIKRMKTHKREKPYKCTECEKSFHQKGGLLAHHRTHTGEKPYQCTKCEKRFIQKGNLMVHLRRHNEKKTEFENAFFKKGGTLTHVRTRKGVKPYKCDECEKSFHQKGALLLHHRTHKGKKPHQCTKCEKSYSMKAHLVNHQKSHTGAKYRTERKKSLIRKGHLMAHLRRDNKKRKGTEFEETNMRTDKGEKPYKCTECEKSFHQKGGLLIHYRTHTGERPYHCTTCEKSFSIKRNLVVHQKRHTGEKPYQCTQCEKGFIQRGQLKAHLKIHNAKGKSIQRKKSFHQTGVPITYMNIPKGEKPYKCTECEKSFHRKGSLLAHLRTHTGEKPYQCNTCAKSFSAKTTLVTHQRRHTGEKPYPCSTCEKNFRTKAHLVSHQKRHAGEK